MLFIKRHKLLFVLFLVCMFFIVKNSSIPYPFVPPWFISLLFDAPQSEMAITIAPIIDVFTTAYVTSILFYLMVDFYPAVNKEKKAKEIIMPMLVSLYLYISEFLAQIEHLSKKQGVFSKENPSSMDKLVISNATIFCKQRHFENEVEHETGMHSYNPFKDSDKFRNLILDTCSRVASTPTFSYCDSELVHIISEIQLNKLFMVLPKTDDPFYHEGIEASCLGLGKDYWELYQAQKNLSKYVDIRHEYQIVDATKDEIDKWQKNNQVLLEQRPELIRALAALHQGK